jgi:hypothetical protein
MNGKSVFALLGGYMLLVGCERQSAPAAAQAETAARFATAQASSLSSPSSPTVSSPVAVSSPASNADYGKVASRLDTGGIAYVYWNGAKIFSELAKSFGPVADIAASEPGLTTGEKERIRNYLNLAGRLTAAGGINNIKGFGFSSTESEPGIFLNKSFLYAPDRSGFLWDTFGKKPHQLTELNMVPEKSAAFAFYDFDLPLLWRAIFKELESSKVPETAGWQEEASQQVKAFVGLPLDDFLDSLGDGFGIIVTLDAERLVEIPVGDKPWQMPAPAAALVLKVKSARIFDRFDALMKLNPKVQGTDEPDLKLRVLNGMSSLSFVNPAIALSGDYLIFSTNEEIVRAIVDTRNGKEPGIRSNAEFARLAEGMPQAGNCVAYVNTLFQQSLTDLQIKVGEMQEAQSPLLAALTAKMARLSANISSYTVGGFEEDGWFARAKTTKGIDEVLEGVASLPAYYAAFAAIEYIKETRRAGLLTKIKQNLSNLQAAKDEAAAEKNFENGQILTRQDIAEYLSAWPDSVTGETYEVGAVGQPPYATAPVDLDGYPAGTKIEP